MKKSRKFDIEHESQAAIDVARHLIENPEVHYEGEIVLDFVTYGIYRIEREDVPPCVMAITSNGQHIEIVYLWRNHVTPEEVITQIRKMHIEDYEAIGVEGVSFTTSSSPPFRWKTGKKLLT